MAISLQKSVLIPLRRCMRASMSILGHICCQIYLEQYDTFGTILWCTWRWKALILEVHQSYVSLWGKRMYNGITNSTWMTSRLCSWTGSVQIHIRTTSDTWIPWEGFGYIAGVTMRCVPLQLGCGFLKTRSLRWMSHTDIKTIADAAGHIRIYPVSVKKMWVGCLPNGGFVLERKHGKTTLKEGKGGRQRRQCFLQCAGRMLESKWPW